MKLRTRCRRQVGGSTRWQSFRQVKAGDTDPVVGHSVIDVEAIRRAEIVTPVTLAAAATVRSPLVISFRLKRNAEPFDSGWGAGLIEFYAGDANA